MDVNSISAFDFDGITQGCWKTCDSKNGLYSYEADSSFFPLYRDPNTLSEFLEVVKFFGCVDICQSTFNSKRFAFLAPICIGGKNNYQLEQYDR